MVSKTMDPLDVNQHVHKVLSTLENNNNMQYITVNYQGCTASHIVQTYTILRSNSSTGTRRRKKDVAKIVLLGNFF